MRSRTRRTAKEPATLDAYEALAKARLSRKIYDFVAGGAGDEATVRENRAALARLKRAVCPTSWRRQSFPRRPPPPHARRLPAACGLPADNPGTAARIRGDKRALSSLTRPAPTSLRSIRWFPAADRRALTAALADRPPPAVPARTTPMALGSTSA